MTELVDYSGPFDPNFSFDKLTRETLLKLIRTDAEYVRRIDGQWYLAVMEKCGNDIAFACDTEIWEKLEAYTMKTTCNLLNIHGDDVVTLIKALQANPWSSSYKFEVDLINNDHAIISFINCPTLLALERDGTGREKLICNELEVKLMELKAHYFNPNMIVIPLKLPPRDPNSEICCQWELKVER
jgi:hypothetical protein